MAKKILDPVIIEPLRVPKAEIITAIDMKFTPAAPIIRKAVSAATSGERRVWPALTGWRERLDRRLLASSALKIAARKPVRTRGELLLEPMERRVERPLLDPHELPRGALDVLGDTEAMARPEAQRAQDEQVERALERGGAAGGGHPVHLDS